MSNRPQTTAISQNIQKSKKPLPSPLSQESKRSHKSRKSQESHSSQSHPSQQNSIIHQHVMQQAIQKASCLIQLLTRQNSQSKQLIQQLHEQVQSLRLSKKQLQMRNDSLQYEYRQISRQLQKIQGQNQQLLFTLQKQKLYQQDQTSTKQKLQQSGQKIKKLHQKIAYLTTKNSELSKNLQAINKEYKSLQNENDYLLNELKKHNQKQNLINLNVVKKESQFKEKLNNVDRTKQAFARRTEQLKQQNIALYAESQHFRKENQALLVINNQIAYQLNTITQQLGSYNYFQQKICRIFDKITLTMTKQREIRNQINDKSTFQQRPSQNISLAQMLDEIQSVVAYRFQHIQSLLKKICQKLEKPSWKTNLREAGQMQLLLQRITNYVSQLANSSAKLM